MIRLGIFRKALVMAGVVFGLVWNISLEAQESTIHMKDGRELVGPASVTAQGILQWKRTSKAAPINLKTDEVLYAVFPEPDSWGDALEALEAGNLSTAESLFGRMATNRINTYYYPIPGNYSTKAQVKLMEIYRQKGDYYKLARIYKITDWNKLVPTERGPQGLYGVWAAVGDKEWDNALKLANQVELANPGVSNELGFVRAQAYKEKGDASMAVISLAETYGPYMGVKRDMAKSAMIEAANVMVRDAERQPELKALVHTYAAVYGDGKLWDGAPSLCVELLAKPLETAGGPTTSSQTNKDDLITSEGKVTARFVRLSMFGKRAEGFCLAEVEVMSNRYNIAPKAKVSAKADSSRIGCVAELAIDGKTDRKGEFFRVKADVIDPWVMIDLGEMTPIDSVIVWSGLMEEGGRFMENKDFTVGFLDGEKKVIVEVKGQTVSGDSLKVEPK